jgi:acetyl esterase/lipase
MILDPDAERLLAMVREAGRPPLEALAPPEARLAYSASRAATQPEPQEVASVTDMAAPGPHGNVPVRFYVPAGVAGESAQPCLVYFHGGGWVLGDLESHDGVCRHLANASGCRVLSVDYRMAPEYHYPAASEDVAAVYRELLKHYRPENIGIYGCSAGGILTAEATAWIRQKGLPRPGAIGTFCGTGAPFTGDSTYLGAVTMGDPPPSTPPPGGGLTQRYLAGVPLTDSAAWPMLSETELKAMPPTLLLAGGRDFTASSLTLAHRKLTLAGTTSELQIFDGLSHAFFVWAHIPESHEAYRIIANFFDSHLGTAPTNADAGK